MRKWQQEIKKNKTNVEKSHKWDWWAPTWEFSELFSIRSQSRERFWVVWHYPSTLIYSYINYVDMWMLWLMVIISDDESRSRKSTMRTTRLKRNKQRIEFIVKMNERCISSGKQLSVLYVWDVWDVVEISHVEFQTCTSSRQQQKEWEELLNICSTFFHFSFHVY